MQRKGDPNRRNPLQGGEHDVERGEFQRRGGTPLGVPPPLPPVRIGIAPPDPMVVVSNFDTRPIGAYDFSVSGFGDMGNSEADQVPLDIEFDVPNGYTLVLRRVLVEVNPPAVAELLSPASVSERRVEIKLLRDGGVIPNNIMVVRGDFSDLEWLTHQVFGMNQRFGVRFFAPFGFDVPSDNDEFVTVTANLQGTLIPSKSRPPEVEVASDPVLVRVYRDPKAIGDER